MTPRLSYPERFWAKVNKTESCWLWTACTLSPSGYGMFTLNGKGHLAHRVAYQMANGVEIPKGLQIDHLCRTRNCVNPSHLEVVSPKENVLRGIGVTALNKLKIRCPQGHMLDGSNTYLSKKGRSCKKCLTENTRRYREKNRRKLNGIRLYCVICKAQLPEQRVRYHAVTCTRSCAYKRMLIRQKVARYSSTPKSRKGLK